MKPISRILVLSSIVVFVLVSDPQLFAGRKKGKNAAGASGDLGSSSSSSTSKSKKARNESKGSEASPAPAGELARPIDPKKKP